MSSFYICHCGNTEDNHYFKHEYLPTCNVIRNRDNKEDIFELDANFFPTKTKIKCSNIECRYDKNIHNSDIVKHEFIPKEFNYRCINLTIPSDTRCNYFGEERCAYTLKDHKKVMTHHFKTKVIIHNKADSDIVCICDSDDDIKILY